MKVASNARLQTIKSETVDIYLVFSLFYLVFSWCFPVKFAKFLRALSSVEHLW